MEQEEDRQSYVVLLAVNCARRVFAQRGLIGDINISTSDGTAVSGMSCSVQSSGGGLSAVATSDDGLNAKEKELGGEFSGVINCIESMVKNMLRRGEASERVTFCSTISITRESSTVLYSPSLMINGLSVTIKLTATVTSLIQCFRTAVGVEVGAADHSSSSSYSVNIEEKHDGNEDNVSANIDLTTLAGLGENSARTNDQNEQGIDVGNEGTDSTVPIQWMNSTMDPDAISSGGGYEEASQLSGGGGGGADPRTSERSRMAVPSLENLAALSTSDFETSTSTSGLNNGHSSARSEASSASAHRAPPPIPPGGAAGERASSPLLLRPKMSAHRKQQLAVEVQYAKAHPQGESKGSHSLEDAKLYECYGSRNRNNSSNSSTKR